MISISLTSSLRSLSILTLESRSLLNDSLLSLTPPAPDPNVKDEEDNDILHDVEKGGDDFETGEQYVKDDNDNFRRKKKIHTKKPSFIF